MNTVEWITIAVAILLSLGGMVMSFIMTLLTFIGYRLVKAMDKLTDSVEQGKIDLIKRPIYEETEEIAMRVADYRTVKHENEKKHPGE